MSIIYIYVRNMMSKNKILNKVLSALIAFVMSTYIFEGNIVKA